MGNTSVSGKKRLAITLLGVAVMFFMLMLRLFWVMIIQGAELSEKAILQQTQDTSLTAARGSITDAGGVVLAQSGTAYKVLLNPYQMSLQKYRDDRQRIALELSEILEMDYDYVLSQVQKQNSAGVYYKEVILKRQVERDVIDALNSRQLGPGVYTAIDSKRYYPNGSLFSQLLGFTTIDGVGQSGLEQKYDKYLAGEDGRMITETDAVGSALAYGAQEIIEPVNGYDVVLTTDSAIQSFLEKALKEAKEVNQAETAQGIVMNCKTGAIVALSTQPDYDPNDPPRDDITTLNALSRNRVVSDSYEPGSTFKILTLSSALDSGAVDLATGFYCPGYYIVNGERIKCWKAGGHGSETLEKAVQNSCNPAFMQMALRMGVDTFYDYIYAFGLGSTTASGISGETSGIVTHQKYMTENTLARIGFGQSIAVSPIQLVTAVCAAVNGGELMQPYVVDRIVSQSGEIILQNEPTTVRRVISKETSGKVRDLLESVVAEGSGKNAAIPGYRVGGKTGTAQKYEDGKIAEGKLIASFIGFAPADDPEYVCLILVDEPKVGTIFGSTVAAPFVKQVMEETLRHYGYLPTESVETVSVPDLVGMSINEAKAVLKANDLGAVYQDAGEDIVIAQVCAANEIVQKGSEVLLYTDKTGIEITEAEVEMVTVPNVMGRTRLSANDQLAEAGLKILIDPPDQSGVAFRQYPEAGTKVEAGTEVLVEFENAATASMPGSE
ncbi:MAG: PASTA domain-containing protein [Clostridia bacterium]|nr:penicillin-binding transpeptidase domain-containing protein [Candidatus Pelethousia sp.]NCB29952.1 PASTA domain-containing protein [Clostridia bacterium]